MTRHRIDERAENRKQISKLIEDAQDAIEDERHGGRGLALVAISLQLAELTNEARQIRILLEDARVIVDPESRYGKS